MKFAIEIKEVTKIYDGYLKALDNVNLSIDEGKIFALLGPNGAGKTTLMRILTTQIKCDSGEAYICGLNISNKDKEIRKIIGYIPQEMSVWTDITGFENLLIYTKIYGISREKRKPAIDGLLDIMELTEFGNKLVKTYSGGLIRRLEMACALLIRPKILFLDEPTIGLDPSARKNVWKRILSLKKEWNMTVFLNTHYMDEADLYSDEIAFINKGRIIKRGTPEELKHSVKGDMITFTLERIDLSENIIKEIENLDAVDKVIWDKECVDIIVKDAEISLAHIVEIFIKNNVAIKKISINKPILDDVFLKYVGGRIESSDRISEVRQMRKMIRMG